MRLYHSLYVPNLKLRRIENRGRLNTAIQKLPDMVEFLSRPWIILGDEYEGTDWPQAGCCARGGSVLLSIW